MLRVGGLTPLSASDYPGKLSAVVFCQGCAWRCTYCHNPHLLEPKADGLIPWDRVMDFLERRRGLVDAVVFSGGEPTLQLSLPHAMKSVKNLGYLIGLHTAGIVPRMLERVLPLVDWVAMDLKSERDDHEAITRVKGSGRRASQSVQIIRASRAACRFHTVDGSGVKVAAVEPAAP